MEVRVKSQQGLVGYTEELWVPRGSLHREAHGDLRDMSFIAQRGSFCRRARGEARRLDTQRTMMMHRGKTGALSQGSGFWGLV